MLKSFDRVPNTFELFFFFLPLPFSVSERSCPVTHLNNYSHLSSWARARVIPVCSLAEGEQQVWLTFPLSGLCWYSVSRPLDGCLVGIFSVMGIFRENFLYSSGCFQVFFFFFLNLGTWYLKLHFSSVFLWWFIAILPCVEVWLWINCMAKLSLFMSFKSNLNEIKTVFYLIWITIA